VIGIKAIGTYVPSTRIDNFACAAELAASPDFVLEKIGFRRRAVKGEDETTLSMAERATRNLLVTSDLDPGAIDALVVVTQNPDRHIPHVSAELHGRLQLDTRCACFDLSLGCSGYVYGLGVLSSFMAQGRLEHGVLVTADPYSGIIDGRDRNTALLFGDAATATLLSNDARLALGSFTYGTAGLDAHCLATVDGRLSMNGRAILTFGATAVPADIRRVLEMNGVALEDVDAFVFHQASRYLVDTITSRLGVDPARVRFSSTDYGNTVSSSIPLILADELPDSGSRVILACGFGAGLSWASTILTRTLP
jgi:3-oxoacyl-[acyl-carrier-protein] synthase-3